MKLYKGPVYNIISCLMFFAFMHVLHDDLAAKCLNIKYKKINKKIFLFYFKEYFYTLRIHYNVI